MEQFVFFYVCVCDWYIRRGQISAKLSIQGYVILQIHFLGV